AEDTGSTADTTPDASGRDGGGRAGRDTATCRASLADALVQVAETYLSEKIARAGNPDLYQVIVHVGPEALLDEPDPATTPSLAGVSAETPGAASWGPAGVSAETSASASSGTADHTPAPTMTPSGPSPYLVPAPAGVSAETSDGTSLGP